MLPFWHHFGGAASLLGISPQEPLKLSEPRKGIRTLILDNSDSIFGELPHFQEFRLKSPLKLSEPRKHIRTLMLDHSGTIFGELPHFQEFHFKNPLKFSEPRKGIRTLILDHSGTIFEELPHFQEFRPGSPLKNYPSPERASERSLYHIPMRSSDGCLTARNVAQRASVPLCPSASLPEAAELRPLVRPRRVARSVNNFWKFEPSQLGFSRL